MANISFIETLKEVFPSKKRKREKIFSAQEAYSVVRHGEVKTIEQLIKERQDSINESLKDRLSYHDRTPFTNYNFLVEIDRDLSNYTDQVFAPFKEKGYTICNVSEKFPEIGDCLVFIISWANRQMIIENNVEKTNGIAC